MALLAEAFVKVRPDFTGFGAELRKQLMAQVPIATQAGSKAGDAWAASFRRSLAQIKRDMQNAGVADFFDINIPPSKLYSQALILKRVLQRAGLSDILGVNLSVSQVTEQIGKLAKETIPLNLVADTAALENITLPKLAELHVPVKWDIGKLPEVPWVLKGMTEQLKISPSFKEFPALLDLVNGRLLDMAKDTVMANAAFDEAHAEAVKFNDALNDSAEDTARLINEIRDLTAAVGGGGNGGLAGAAGRAAGGARRFGVAWGAAFGGVAVWHIALDGILESIISVTGALAALGIGVSAVAPTFQDIGTQMKNVKAIQDAMGVSLKPLTGQWQNLQQALAPQAIEIFGGALNAVNHQSSIFATTAHQVVTMFDDWIASIDLWVKGNKTMQSFLQNGVIYLGQFAKIIGTLGQAIANLLTKDPGIAHFLLDIVQGAASVLNWITKLPGPLITLGIALHASYVWGGALAGVFVRLLTGVGLTGLMMKLGLASKTMTTLADGTKKATYAFLGLKAIQWGFLAFIGAGFAYLVTQGNQAQTSLQNFVNTMKSNLTNLPASQQIPQIAADIGTLNAKLHDLYSAGSIARVAQQIEHVGSVSQSVGLGLHGMWSSFINLFTSRSFSDAGRALNNLFTPGGNATQAARQVISQNARLINDAINSLFGGYRNLATEAGNLMGWHDRLSISLTRTGVIIHTTTGASKTYQQALLEMDMAGVKWNDTVAVMQQKIANLETGYANLGISGTLFTNTLDAMNFATLQSQSNISKVTGGFDAFFKTISSGESGFNSFVTALQTFRTSAKAAGASLTGLNPVSITLRTNFIAAAQAAQTEMDNLMTLASASGLGAGAAKILAQSARDLIAPLLGAASGSAGLTQLLIALATQGGAQNITTFKQLAKWVGNVKDPMKNLDKQVTTLTVDAGNLTKDVQNLSTALGTTLNGAMATAIFDASGGQQAFTAFAKSVLGSKFDSDQMKTAAINLGRELVITTGSTSKAHDMFVTFAMSGLHLTKEQADLLWQQSLPALQSAIDKLHGTEIDLTVRASAEGDVTAFQKGLTQFGTTWALQFHAAGGQVTGGTPGRDSVLVAAMPGEVIVPASMVGAGAVDHLRGKLPGFSAGGVVGSVASRDEGFVGGLTTGWAQRVGESWAAAAIAAAKAKASQFIPPFPGGGGGTPSGNALLAFNAYQSVMGPGDWAAWNFVAMRESGWNQFATNPSSGAYGIPQALPYTKMPVTAWPLWAGGLSLAAPQIQWMWNYMGSVYGGPQGAAAHEMAFNWYDRGGPLPGGWSMAWNGTGRAEVVAPSGLDDLIAAVQENTDAICASIDTLTSVSAAAPAATGGSMAQALNGVARSAGYSALYNPRP